LGYVAFIFGPSVKIAAAFIAGAIYASIIGASYAS